MLMKNLLRLIWFSLAVLTFAFLTAPFARSKAATQERIPDGIDNTQRVALHGQVHRLARPEFDEGSVAGSTLLEHMTLVFSPSAAQQQDLNALLAAQQDRNSPLYHQWLSTEQYGARFGLGDSDLAKVKDWLQQQGFTVTEVAASRDYMAFYGTAAQVKSAFGTEIHHYAVRGEDHISNSSEPVVPSAIASVVSTIWGLNDFRPHAHAVRPRLTSYVSGNHFITPDDFATIYDLKPLYAQTCPGGVACDGTGQKIAVVGQTDIQQGDIDTFRRLSGLPATNLQITNISTGYVPGVSSSDLTEADLDVEWAGAIAPNAQIIFVTSGGGRNNAGAFAALQYAVANSIAPVISVSYGECEAQAGSDVAAISQVTSQAAAQGITVVAASGDSGAADCDPPTSAAEVLATQGISVDLPGASPYVTAVGGTQLNDVGSTSACPTANTSTFWSAGNNTFQGSALSYIPETAWNSTSCDNTMAGSGGGVSTQFTSTANNGAYASALAFQKNVTPDNGTARDVPDIALTASVDHDGLIMCSGGSCTNGFRNADTTFTVVGGTSAGTPTFAAMIALLNQMESSAGQGAINSQLYPLAGSPGFHFINAGTNKIPCGAGTPNCPTTTAADCPVFLTPPSGTSANNPCFGYSAATLPNGTTSTTYNLVTGLGSVDAFKLLNVMKSGTVPSAPADFSISGAPASLNVARSGSATFTAAFNGAASPINVSCFVGGGANPTNVTGMTCTPSAATVTTSGTQVTFTVTAASQVSSVRPDQPLNAPWSMTFTAMSALVFCGGAATGIFRKKRRTAKQGGVFLALCALFALAVLVSCGGGSSSTTTPQTTAAGPAVSALAISPNAVIGTNSVTGTVTLASAAPTGGTTVSLSSNSPAATVPASVSVAAGATTGNFSVVTKSVTTPTAVAITATTSGGSQTASLNVTGVTIVVQGSVGPNNGTAFGSNVHVAAVPVNLQ
jgi:hypothetical protein